MKAKVLKEYIDKETKVHNRKDNIVEVTKERYKEINGTVNGKLLQEIPEVEKVEDKKDNPKPKKNKKK